MGLWTFLGFGVLWLKAFVDAQYWHVFLCLKAVRFCPLCLLGLGEGLVLGMSSSVLKACFEGGVGFTYLRTESVSLQGRVCNLRGLCRKT